MRHLAAVGLGLAAGCASLAGLDDYGRAGASVGGGGSDGGSGGLAGAGGAGNNGGAPSGPGGAGGVGSTVGGGGQGGSGVCDGAFADDFGLGTLDKSTWSPWPTDDMVSVVDRAVQFQWDGIQTGLYSTTFSLVDCEMVVQLVESPPGDQQAFFYYQTPRNTNERAGFKLYNDQLLFRRIVDGSETMGTVKAFDDATMAWWRLRVEGTTLRWHTSGNGSDWILQHSAEAESIIAVDRGINLGGGVEGSVPGFGGATFDDVEVSAHN